jgi:hypothetical protein
MHPLSLTRSCFCVHPRVSHQLLLTNWRKGAKDGNGKWTIRPWDKKARRRAREGSEGLRVGVYVRVRVRVGVARGGTYG